MVLGDAVYSVAKGLVSAVHNRPLPLQCVVWFVVWVFPQLRGRDAPYRLDLPLRTALIGKGRHGRHLLWEVYPSVCAQC